MIPKYNFPDHIKGDTFPGLKVIFNFDITGADIKLEFKENPSSDVAYYWSTENGSIIIDNAVSGMTSLMPMIIDVTPSTYNYDLQVINSGGVVTTYFYGSQKITQDITT